MNSVNNFQELLHFLSSKTGLRMSHIYKPVMLLGVIRRGGSATRTQIAEDFALSDSEQIAYYKSKVVHRMPGVRLVRDGLLEKHGEVYSLAPKLAQLNKHQLEQICAVLEQRITDYLDIRYPFGDSNNDAVRGSIRYQVLKAAGGRCELCGASSKDIQIDVDHIVPRAKGGSNEVDNLQALCRTCNAQKRDRDDANIREMQAEYSLKSASCVFCELPAERIVAENELALAFRDGFPVTPLHTLVIPKRHAADYFALHQSEVTAINRLLQSQRLDLLKRDGSIEGFNVGINSGEVAGQTIFHTHVHLIPRRSGDVDEPRGGIRHLIPGKGSY